MKTKLPLSLIFFCFVLIHPAITLAEDKLRVCGIVQKIDREKITVTVEVLSSSCPGVQMFKLPDVQSGTFFIIDERKCFVIDSNRCDDAALHRIIEIVGE